MHDLSLKKILRLPGLLVPRVDWWLPRKPPVDSYLKSPVLSFFGSYPGVKKTQGARLGAVFTRRTYTISGSLGGCSLYFSPFQIHILDTAKKEKAIKSDTCFGS